MKKAIEWRNHGKSNTFKGVYFGDVFNAGRAYGIKYIAKKTFKNKKWASKLFDTEIEAAKAYDMHLIGMGLEPVNIFKRK